MITFQINWKNISKFHYVSIPDYFDFHGKQYLPMKKVKNIVTIYALEVYPHPSQFMFQLYSNTSSKDNIRSLFQRGIARKSSILALGILDLVSYFLSINKARIRNLNILLQRPCLHHEPPPLSLLCLSLAAVMPTTGFPPAPRPLVSC